MAKELPHALDEAIAALEHDRARTVLVKVDEDLTVEVRSVRSSASPKKSAADAVREIGRWEGETGAQLDALFVGVRERSNGIVSVLP